MEKVTIIGGSGQVGTSLRDAAPAAHLDLRTRNTTPAVDLADPRSFESLFAQDAPRVLVIAAGYTHVEAAQRDETGAFAVNCDGPARLASLAREHDTKVIYFSTDYVFNGEAGPYKETDEPAPLSVYGRSKLAGEQAIAAATHDHLIIRTCVVYGADPAGKNALYQVLRAKPASPLAVANDQLATPTYNQDLAAATWRLIENDARGVWHVAGPKALTRSEFARQICRTFGQSEACLRSQSTGQSTQVAPRPLRGGLNIDKLRRLDGGLMQAPQEALKLAKDQVSFAGHAAGLC